MVWVESQHRKRPSLRMLRELRWSHAQWLVNIATESESTCGIIWRILNSPVKTNYKLAPHVICTDNETVWRKHRWRENLFSHSVGVRDDSHYSLHAFTRRRKWKSHGKWVGLWNYLLWEFFIAAQIRLAWHWILWLLFEPQEWVYRISESKFLQDIFLLWKAFGNFSIFSY